MKLVIDIPNEGYDWIKNGFPDNEDKEFLIEAVRNGKPYEEGQPGDCISRSKLMKTLLELPDDTPTFFYSRCLLERQKVIDTIDNAPTVEINTNDIEYKAYCKGLEDGKKIARPQGKWITVKQDTILGNFEVNNKVCDQCNHATKYEYPFCPWCGADMRKGGAV